MALRVGDELPDHAHSRLATKPQEAADQGTQAPLSRLWARLFSPRNPDFGNLRRLDDLLHEEAGHREIVLRLIYGGDHHQDRHAIDVLPWRQITDPDWE
jgi:hypothetical protein